MSMTNLETAIEEFAELGGINLRRATWEVAESMRAQAMRGDVGAA